jgi:glyoxylase-like metal-dependent hydrolase (beta-lactamase superfamily II)
MRRNTTQATPEVVSFFDAATAAVTHIVCDPESRMAAVIDPVLGYDPKSGRTDTRAADQVLDAAAARGWRISLILETHAHADHLSAAQYLKSRTGARVAIGEHIGAVQAAFKPLLGDEAQPTDGQPFDLLMREAVPVALGGLWIETLETPGHTPACVTYKIADALFPGDTLFMPDYGTARADFPGGDARQLYRSIQRILALPDQTRMFLCHDYGAPGRTEPKWETTVQEQREKNVHLAAGVSQDAFVAMRTARDKTLAAPALLWPSIQVNIRAGLLPEPERNGRAYLKIPLNAL